jgi:hypothetical protein
MRALPCHGIFEFGNGVHSRIIAAIMLMQRLYVITSPNCRETTPLPRQSLLGTFEHPQCRPTDVWPITYLCSGCETPSVYSAEAIHQQGVEVLDPNLLGTMLICHEFDRESDGEKTRVFSRLDAASRQNGVLEKLLRDSGSIGGTGRLIRHFPA